MKGVILRVAPTARLIDLTHQIAPGDVRAGAFSLAASYRFFPRHTVHLAVVDPGVGTARAAIAVQTTDYWFVGPDNGVLSLALQRETIHAVHLLENPLYRLPEISTTFHGRDVFAPAAAHLAQGVAIEKLGTCREGFVHLPSRPPAIKDQMISGEVLYVDRFGNLITNIPSEAVSCATGEAVVMIGRKRLCKVQATYGAVPSGQFVAVIGSTGFLEIAVNLGNAAKRLNLQTGAKVRVQLIKRMPAEARGKAGRRRQLRRDVG